ncbi:MAG: hypothetical protein KGV51_01640 [Moraxellaceae bacterium]|nr:hypothetical protein [Moraxellaceae bacterium]
MKYFYPITLLICLSSCSTINNSDIFAKETQKIEEQQRSQFYNPNCKLSRNLPPKISKDTVEELGKWRNQMINCHGFMD